VVTTGADLAGLKGAAPGDIVAFRHTGTRWEQVPVQVDERKTIDLGATYNRGPAGVTAAVYADPVTWTGPDTDPTFDDDDDELVFMARDTGITAPAGSGEPAGVVPGSGVALAVTDPADPGSSGYAYLYRRSGPSLDPAAGKRYVDYDFSLASGDYRRTYRLQAGPNPEDTTVTTAAYSRHFSDRFTIDALSVTAPGASGVDIYDLRKTRFAVGQCGRTEATFNAGGGAFITNKNGPVRGIRAVIGTNSGPYTTKTHLFYESREDVFTDLRVHAIPGIIEFDDYSEAAIGMTYSDQSNPAGVRIDGVPDQIVTGRPVWQKVDGPQGSVLTAPRLITNTTVPFTSYYEDDATPAANQCTGDRLAYGNHGNHINGAIPNTDPRLGGNNHLRGYAVITYGSPGMTSTAAAARASRAWTALTVSRRCRAPLMGRRSDAQPRSAMNASSRQLGGNPCRHSSDAP
jgi:hypothetical protein